MSEEAREMGANGEGMWAKERAAATQHEMAVNGEGTWAPEAKELAAAALRARATPAGHSCSGGECCKKTFAVWVGTRGYLCRGCHNRRRVSAKNQAPAAAGRGSRQLPGVAGAIQ